MSSFRFNRNDRPPPEKLGIPARLKVFPRVDWRGITFGPASHCVPQSEGFAEEKLYWACREASNAWKNAIDQRQLDLALPPTFKPQHQHATTEQHKMENAEQRQLALEESLLVAVAAKALEINTWHRNVRRIYNVNYLGSEEWLNERWGACHTANEAEEVAHQVVLAAFPNEAFLHDEYLRGDCMEYSVQALSIVWERFVDSTRHCTKPPELLHNKEAIPWLPRLSQLPLERWVAGVAVDEYADGAEPASLDVVYYDAKGNEVLKPTRQRKENLAAWEDKYGSTYAERSVEGLPMYSHWFETQAHIKQSTKSEAAASGGPVTPRRPAPTMSPMTARFASPTRTPTSSSSPGSKPSDRSRSSQHSRLSQSTGGSTAFTSDPGTSTSHEAREHPDLKEPKE